MAVAWADTHTWAIIITTATDETPQEVQRGRAGGRRGQGGVMLCALATGRRDLDGLCALLGLLRLGGGERVGCALSNLPLQEPISQKSV